MYNSYPQIYRFRKPINNMEDNIFNTDLGKKFLALTKACFRTSDLITDLVLREKIKGQVLSVYKLFSNGNNSELLKEVDALDGLFHLGGHLGLVKDEHLKLLRNGLLVFKSHIVLNLHQKPRHTDVFDSAAPASAAKQTDKKVVGDLTERHQKLLARFPDKETQLQLSDFAILFPELSDRTIRNDLADLIELGKITRQGMGSGSYYNRKE